MGTKAHEKTPTLNGGVAIVVKNNDIEKAIRSLKRQVAVDGTLRELRKREYFEKPSVIARKKKQEAIKRWRKVERTLFDF